MGKDKEWKFNLPKLDVKQQTTGKTKLAEEFAVGNIKWACISYKARTEAEI
mgnify:CR=1 FL=1